MKHFSKKQKWRMIGGAVLAVILVLCAWIFGWFRGDINVISFSADEVDRVELSCTDVHVDLYRAVVTDKDDIQMLIDSVNRFQHTGNEIKDIVKHGIFTGGSLLYEIDIYLSDGEQFPFRLASNGRQELSDMEVCYWVHGAKGGNLFPSTCRGSLEPFYALYAKYRPME